MYIQFTDSVLFDNLKEATITTLKMGSHLYGTQTESSDTDYLCIYIDGYSNYNSFLWEHHPLQYKTSDADWNFTTLQKFIRNLINGDSPHNYEVLFSEEILNSDLSWLLEYRSHFAGYNLIRSYLGLVKRDMKDFNKELHGVDRSKITELGYKKLAHAYRGLDTAIALMVGSPYQYYKGGDSEKLSYYKALKTGDVSYDEVKTAKTWIDNNLELVREQLNDMLNRKDIAKIMRTNIAQELDEALMDFCRNYTNEHGQGYYINYGTIPYNAMENGVTY